MGAIPSTTSAVPVSTSTSLPNSLFPTTSTSQPVPTGPAHYLFTFGDSYTDTNFNIGGTWPSQGNPLGNPVFPGSTSCAGPNWLGDLLTTSPANTLSYNFARGGATVDIQYAELFDWANPFTLQASRLIDSAVAAVPHPALALWDSTNSAFLIWFGVNDIGITVTQPKPPNVVELIMNTYFATLNQLLAAGAKRFIVMGAPPLWRAPAWQNDVHKANITAQCNLWNSVLKRRATTFNNKHPRAKAIFFDTQPFFNSVLDNPTAYGAPNASCTSTDGVSCLWQDGVHPNLAIHKAVGAGVKALLDANGFFAGKTTPTIAAQFRTSAVGPVVIDRAHQVLYDQELCVPHPQQC